MTDFSLAELRRWLPARPRDSHKGDFGHVLVVAGSRGMGGAAALAARGVLRSGAGLVTVALPASQQLIVAGLLAEAMTLPLPEGPGGALRADAVAALVTAHEKREFTALAIGPGLGSTQETGRVVLGALASLKIPAVLDADALNLLALHPRPEVRILLSTRKAPFVLTPHPGEAARLLREKVEKVVADRGDAALRLVEELGGVCLLKGRRTIVARAGKTWVNPTGNAGLAKGGTGDLLTGIIAGLWSQRLRVNEDDGGFEAACLGAYLHGYAADEAVKRWSDRCLLASDVLESLPAAFKKLGA
ncbi:MAG: NAD(P)H-hydrate dehydratase [Elusimicrobia bacterium]|nr:NAD(P)H-hydrate dehydratase [Elusimicrobiota bacterium]